MTLHRVARAIKRSASKYNGLAKLDKKLAQYLNYRDGFFVELGANDGVTQSNTLFFEKHRGWTGVLIEPTPHNYLKCLKNRSTSSKIFCNACVSFSYEEKFVEIAFSNLMSSPLDLESDILDPVAHAASGARFLEPSERVFTFGAAAKTLNQILTEAMAPAKIDLLSLDVEGAEIEVLKGIDHKSFRFRLICVECRDVDKMTAYLSKHGYGLVGNLSAHDYLFRDLSDDLFSK